MAPFSVVVFVEAQFPSGREVAPQNVVRQV